MTNDSSSDDFDVKKSRLETNPSGWMTLTRYETVRLIVDALLEAPPGYQFNKSELERRAGVSREAIREHIPLLIELGVVEEIDNGAWAEYQLNDDGKVTRQIFQLNNAANSVLAGERKNVRSKPIPAVEEAIQIDEEATHHVFQGEDEVKREIGAQTGASDELIDLPPSQRSVTNAQ
ncbi:winged helix-turn-helix domain-containing protein [Halovenus marina]|uniref:winged helix-turn-helix domain-containing protein n=1 Tax=Halovenus marina TaxID=3396621 RepID=UPI003F5756D1